MRPVALLLVLGVTTPVLGQPRNDAKPELERSEGRFLWLLPELKISAQTTGSSEFQLRGSAVWGLWEDADFLLWPIAKVQTSEGLATLISVDSSSDTATASAVPWRLGLAVGYMRFGKKDPTPIAKVHEHYKRADEVCRTKCPSATEPFCANRAAVLAFRKRKAADVALDSYCSLGRETLLAERVKLNAAAAKVCQDSNEAPDATCSKWQEHYIEPEAKARQAAFDSCFARCDGLETTGFCHAAIEGPPHEGMDAGELCEDGKKIVKQLRDDEALLPPLVISAGAIAGEDGFKYYEAGETDTSLLVEKKDERRLGIRGGVLATIVPTRWATFEAGVLLEGKAAASPTALRFCSPQGNVERADQEYDAEDPATFDVASTCKESVLGAPAESTSLELLAEYGLTGPQGIGWRVAAGPHVKLAGREFSSLRLDSVSVQVPLYVDLQALPKEYGAYRGLLRLTPAIERYRDEDGEWQGRFTLTLAVLAQRTLFGVVADAL